MKPKRLTPLSHKEFKHNYIATENPRIIAIRQQAKIIDEKVKKEGING